MAEIKIDPDKFFEILRQAFATATVESSHIDDKVMSEEKKETLKRAGFEVSNNVEEFLNDIEVKPQKKRGRPRKNIIPIDKELEDINSKLPPLEEIDIKPIQDFPPSLEGYIPPIPQRSSLNPIIRNTPLEMDGRRAKKRQFEPPKGPNKFVDRKLEHIDDTFSKVDPSKKVMYPQRSDRREPAQEVRIRCQKCGKEFMGFARSYSNIKEVINIKGESIVLVATCNCIAPN